MLDSVVDIVVTSPSHHNDLVVKVKLASDLETATSQLREYMRRTGAPIGLIVGREMVRVLREMYRGHPSIQMVGEFPIRLMRGLKLSNDPAEFEDNVQRWVESLQRGEDVAEAPLLPVLREHVIPTIEEGTVRAAGPRRTAR